MIKTDNYKISVIVPVFNVKEYLNCAIDSLVNQTIGFENIQVIIVDDCSNDGSKEIIMEYEKKYDNILAIYRKNNSGGAAIPRNDALEYVEADYIMFLDPDDYYSKDFCETMYEKITTNNVDLVKCNNSSVINDSKKVLNPYFSSQVGETLINTETLTDGENKPLISVAVWSGIHKTNIIKRNNIYFPDCVSDDIVFSINEFMYVDKILYLNDYFGYTYRILDDSHSKSPSIEKICSMLWGFELSIDIVQSHNRENVANIILGHYLAGIYERLKDNEDSLEQKKLVLEKVNDIQKALPNLIVPNSNLYKIAIVLTKYKLFYLVFAYLKFAKFCKNSKMIMQFYRKVILGY